MNKITTFLVLIISVQLLHAQFDPDAGLIPSYTDAATLSASSNISTLPYCVDGDDQTQWISDSPFPQNYVTRADLNVFLSESFNCSHSSPVDCTKFTDGNLGVNELISASGGQAFLEFDFTAGLIPFAYLSVKGQYNGTVNVIGYDASNTPFTITTLNSSNDYAFVRVNVPSEELRKIRFESTANFRIFEVAATASKPKEYVVIDLGSVQTVGKIYTRHWAGTTTGGISSAETVELFRSNDGINWTTISTLVPTAIPIIVTDISNTPQAARYIKVEYTLEPIDYNKVYLWEIAVYDECGKYGCMPTASKSSVTMGELLGISGIWGWGNNRYSDLLDPGQGPELYDHICQHYRNYHYLAWDVTDPDIIPDYATMAAGGGTEAFWWLNWDREYQQWIDESIPIQASIQMYQSYIGQYRDTAWIKDDVTLPADPWSDNSIISSVWQSAYDYGYQFAMHFGPTNGNGMIEMLEVGNEPWVYDATAYKTILDGMARGLKDADPNMLVIPCALQAAEENAELSTNFRNYMGARIDEATLPYLDGLNIHIYSYHNRPTGLIYGTHPENLNSIYHEVHSAVRWRDENMPGMPIYVSEWGWDHDGGDPLCTHFECVSERSATAYASRGALMFHRLGMDRATWYFYGDTDIDPTNLANNGTYRYSRSGLTSSKANGFAKKRSFYAMEQLVNQLGDRHFISAEQENDGGWIYLMGDADCTPTHLVAWRPIDGDSTASVAVNWANSLGLIPISAVKIDGLDSLGTVVPLPTYTSGNMTFDIDVFPTIIELQEEYPAVPAKVFLQGPYNTANGLMEGDLNMSSLVPMLEPYTAMGYPHVNGGGGETMSSSITPTSTDDEIVDWVVVELRDASNPATILGTRSALVQRDGDVVDMDGNDMVRFYDLPAGSYHVAIRHRNHLGVMTSTAVALNSFGVQ